MKISGFRAALTAIAFCLASIASAWAFDEHNLVVGQISVTSSVTMVIANRAGRTSATIENLGTTALYCGQSNALNGGLTTSNGIVLPGVVGASITFGTSAEIDCISGGSSQMVSYMEVF